jgi:NADH:ubiquinone oxidoreductase subunit K/NADH:ubiquinone oxidoreductase subunit 6 (subunit J)
MDTNTALFYVFSAVLLLAAFRVITARSPVYAALFLVLAFFSAACVWILLRAEFLAIALVLVYVGAVMVLFLFVVMMLDVDVGSLRAGFWRHFPVAAVVGVVIALEMAAVLLPGLSPHRCADDVGRGAEARQHQGARHRGLHALSLPAPDRGRAAAGRDHRRHLADAADAQGLQAHRPVRAGQGEEGRPRPDRLDEAGAGAARCAERRRQAGGRSAMTLGPVTLGHYLSVGAILFALSVIGIFLNRKNLIILLMAIELMLLAVNLNFVAFSYYLGDMAGQVFVFFILTVAAAESAIGLAILVVLFRTRSTIAVDELDSLKG